MENNPLQALLIQATRSALAAASLTAVLVVPMTGWVLNGYTIDLHWQTPLFLVLLVGIGQFLASIFAQTQRQRAWYQRLGQKTAGVVVVPPHPQRYWLGLVVLGLGLCLPFALSKYWLSVAILVLIYALLGLGLNIVVGLAGLLDLGFVAFYAVGAYSYALGQQYLGLGFWSAIPFAALLAASFGAVLGFPVLRMHGDYLAIVTLGFGEIIRLILNNWVEFTGGPNGVTAPAPTLFGLEFSRQAQAGYTPFHEYFGLEYSSAYRYIFIYLVLLLMVALLFLLVTRLRTMPIGRLWEALREDEIACRSLGINHVTVKLSAFSMGAMVGGIAGVFFAAYQGFVNPASFTFFESALILALVVLGGMGSLVGVILAAVVLTLLPEALREFADYRVLVFGILMVLMMLWRPRGLLKLKRHAIDLPPPIPSHRNTHD